MFHPNYRMLLDCLFAFAWWLHFLDALWAKLPPCLQVSDALWYRFSSSLVICLHLSQSSPGSALPHHPLRGRPHLFHNHFPASRSLRCLVWVCFYTRVGPLALGSGRSGSAINKTENAPRAGSCSLSEICRAAPKHRLGWRRNYRLKVSAVQKKTGCENKRKQTEKSQKLIRSFHHRDCAISPQQRTPTPPPPPHPPPPQ